MANVAAFVAYLFCLGYGSRDHTGYGRAWETSTRLKITAGAQSLKSIDKIESKHSSNRQASAETLLNPWKVLVRLLMKFNPAAMLKVSSLPACFVGIDANTRYAVQELPRARLVGSVMVLNSMRGFDTQPAQREWKPLKKNRKLLKKAGVVKLSRDLLDLEQTMSGAVETAEIAQRSSPSESEERLIRFNAHISACETDGQWEEALSLLQQMRDCDVTPNLISYCTAISACVKGDQRQQALSLIAHFKSIEKDLGLKRYNGSDVTAEELPELKLAERILYEDDDLLVLDKPSGCVVHPSDGNWAGSLLNGVMHYLQDSKANFDWEEQEHLKAWPGVVHRLDKSSSGCIVMAKNAIAHALLMRTFAEHKARKDYLCVSHGKPACSHIEVETLIAQHPTKREMFEPKPLDAETESGEKVGVAKSSVQTLGWGPLKNQAHGKGRQVSLFRVNIHTGRTHQARVHMQHLQNPIVGDDLYGWASPNKFCKNRYGIGRPLLHAHSLSFPHPMRPDETVSVRAPIPDDFYRIAGYIIRELPIHDAGPEPTEDSGDVEKELAADPPELCPDKTWEVELENAADNKNKMGLKVFYGDERILKVVEIQAGLLSEWNSKNPDRAVREGDYITEINGLSGDNVRMLESIPENDRIKIVFNRDPT